MTQIYNKRQKEKHFGVGDLVYLKLQPYRQSSIEVRSNAKLAAKYYEPFKIIKKNWIRGLSVRFTQGV